MQLGREVLDQQAIDAGGRQMGKVDGIVLELRGDQARVAALVVGGTTLLWRLHAGLAAWAERRLGGEGTPTRIPWRQVVKIGIDVKLDVEAERTPAFRWERWVRDHVIGRIPGA
jgi:sporulation protein YlmC with PRC-barrel domain